MKECKNCGKEIADDSRFCTECGADQQLIPKEEELEQNEENQQEQVEEQVEEQVPPTLDKNEVIEEQTIENTEEKHDGIYGAHKEQASEKFFQKTWFIWLMLVLFAPIGIVLMFKYGKNKKALKYMISAVMGAFFIVVYTVSIAVIGSVSKYNHTAQELYEQAVVAYDNGNYLASIEYLDEVVSDYEGAKVYAQAETLLPDAENKYTSALYDDAVSDYHDADYMAAIEKLDEIILHYKNVDIYYDATEFRTEVESGYVSYIYDKANQEYQNKQYTTAIETLGVILNDYKDHELYDDAVALLQKAENDYAKTLYNKASTQYKEKDFAGAITTLESLIADYPGAPIKSDAEKLLSDAQTAKKRSEPIYGGMYKVGTDIPAGEYVLIATGSCYFEICSDSSGSFSSIIANDNIYTHTYVTLKDGNYFEFDDAYIRLAEYAQQFTSDNGVYGEGMYKVGYDIPAGEYKLVPDDDTGSYYEIDKDSTHTFRSIISNDFFYNEKYVTIKNGQYLDISDCKLTKK